jgi:hypothetical protein
MHDVVSLDFRVAGRSSLREKMGKNYEVSNSADQSMKGTTKLRQLLSQPGMLAAPGAHDVMNARLVEAEGLRAVYLGGFATSASMLGPRTTQELENPTPKTIGNVLQSLERQF